MCTRISDVHLKEWCALLRDGSRDHVPIECLSSQETNSKSDMILEGKCAQTPALISEKMGWRRSDCIVVGVVTSLCLTYNFISRYTILLSLFVSWQSRRLLQFRFFTYCHSASVSTHCFNFNALLQFWLAASILTLCFNFDALLQFRRSASIMTLCFNSDILPFNSGTSLWVDMSHWSRSLPRKSLFRLFDS